MANVQTLSDYNVTDQRATVVSKKKLYSDLDLSLTLHPIFHDITPLTDIDAVTGSVRNLVLTNFDERPFQPYLGSNLRGLLFEPADKITIICLRDSIHGILAKYEPRIDSVAVNIADDSDRNRYHVTLSFRVIIPNQTVDMTLYLLRIR